MISLAAVSAPVNQEDGAGLGRGWAHLFRMALASVCGVIVS